MIANTIQSQSKYMGDLIEQNKEAFSILDRLQTSEPCEVQAYCLTAAHKDVEVLFKNNKRGLRFWFRYHVNAGYYFEIDFVEHPTRSIPSGHLEFTLMPVIYQLKSNLMPTSDVVESEIKKAFEWMNTKK